MTAAILPNLTVIPESRSNYISRIGHDAEFLFVEFRRDGSFFRFDGVSKEEFDALMAAPSIGKAFAQSIKSVKPFKRMEKPTNVVAINAPDDDDSLAAKVREYVAKVAAFVVNDVASHTVAQEALHHLARWRARVIKHHEEPKRKSYEAWKSICDAERSLLDPLVEADKSLRHKIGEFTYAQMKLAEEHDRKARLEAETRAIERASHQSQETAIQAALELEAMGDKEGAEAVLAHPMPEEVRYEMPPPVAPAVGRVEGITGTLVYEVTIHDPAAVPREYLVVDWPKTEREIARRAKQMGGRLNVAGATIRETYAPRRAGGRS
jgi:hypothetical protein